MTVMHNLETLKVGTTKLVTHKS